VLTDGTRYSAVIEPYVTEFLITDLERGTSYHAYLEAILDKNVAPHVNTNVLRSWILIAVTKGIGPDYRMFVYLTTSSSSTLLLNCSHHAAVRIRRIMDFVHPHVVCGLLT